MKLRQRAMREEDIRECVDIVASNPVIGSRYGPVIKLLPEAWCRLLNSESQFTGVYHAEEGSSAPICFVGLTVVVHDGFINQIKTAPPFWVGPELTIRMAKGPSPLLNANQLREANSGDGLNMLGWEGCARAGYESHAELHRYMMTHFLRVHQGYFWKEIVATQGDTAERLEFFAENRWSSLGSGSPRIHLGTEKRCR